MDYDQSTGDATIFSAQEFQELTKKKKRGKSKKGEEKLQLQVCDYLRLKYPQAIWFCDLASGVRLPIHIAAKNARMRSSRGLPDLFIANIEHRGLYHGLFLELKREDVRLKSGGIIKSDHHDEQEAIMKRLRQQGYKAEFACGFGEAIKLIDEYMGS